MSLTRLTDLLNACLRFYSRYGASATTRTANDYLTGARAMVPAPDYPMELPFEAGAGVELD